MFVKDYLIMRLEFVPCTVCGATKYTDSCRWDEDEGVVTTLICDCGEEYDEEDVIYEKV